ncbi:hypothetical protein BC936DRAFT_137340 [Jimgerdemannia flammicorona]|uniref:Uncharacterized protein n=1 Tax=Jimgerdemannia flammicorona TaxID=994334 RepID=A0A433CXJ9_9FUNG|nr:hypothetical protein BC936DRAFT_137340 [Jimgerdemannia flammicorona]
MKFFQSTSLFEQPSLIPSTVHNRNDLRHDLKGIELLHPDLLPDLSFRPFVSPIRPMSHLTKLPTIRTILRETQYHIPAIVQHVGDGIGLLHEFRDFVKERAQIEKEYADKLEKLTKRYAVNKNKRKSNNDKQEKLDEDDEWAWDDTESTTFKSWTTILSETESIARSRALFCDKLTTNVTDNLKVIAAKKEEARKKHIAFYQKLKADRDKAYTDRDSAKKAYDDSCEELENLRTKMDKTGDTDKLKKQEEQIIMDRHNNKNVYLISIDVANAQKRKFFEEDIPALADHLQDFNNSRILAFKSILDTYIELEASCLRETQTHLKIESQTVQAMDPNVDAELFINQCISNTSALEISTKGENVAKNQFVFKPWNGGERANGTIVDRVGAGLRQNGLAQQDASLVNDESTVIFLTNVVIKDRKKLTEIEADLEKRWKEVEGLVSQKQKHESANDLPATHDAAEVGLWGSGGGGCRDWDVALDVTNGLKGYCGYNYMEALRHIAVINSFKVRYDTEVAMITEAIGDSALKARGHDFKATSFAIRTTCDYCQATIWGLSKQGFTCKDCGYNCHTKCEMKVPPDCTGIKGKIARRVTVTSQSNTLSKSPTSPNLSPTNTVRSSRSISASSASLQPPTLNASSKPRSTSPATPNPALSKSKTTKQLMATALYDYDADGDDELSVKEGDTLTVLEDDDGSGWIKARKNFREGIVPANYIKIRSPSVAGSPQSPRANPSSYFESLPPAPAQEYVQALYDFKAQNPEELSIRAGDVITLTSKDEGGWWQGELYLDDEMNHGTDYLIHARDNS